jgi:hypothetical protein
VFNPIIALFLTHPGIGGRLAINFIFSQTLGLCNSEYHGCPVCGLSVTIDFLKNARSPGPYRRSSRESFDL